MQFFLIVLGFLPLVFLGLKDVGGWAGLGGAAERGGVAAESATPLSRRARWTSAWQPLSRPSRPIPMGVEWFGMVMGLGFVLSFGYWCTEFPGGAAGDGGRSMSAARRTPLIAAIPKMFFPVLVILPGMIAWWSGSQALQSETCRPVAHRRRDRRGHGEVRPGHHPAGDQGAQRGRRQEQSTIPASGQRSPRSINGETSP